MSKSFCTRPFGFKRLVSGFVGLAAAFGVLFLAAMPAEAGVAVGVTPTFPSTVKAGQTGVPAAVQIAWANSAGNGNDGHANNVTGIELTPSCGTFTTGVDCPSAPTDFREPGVFTLSSSGTGVGCGAVTNFTISVIDAASGKVSITPGFQLPVNGICTINFTMNVNAAATKDADPARSGIQTAVLAGATATDAVNNNPGAGLGSAEISFPTINTTPGAGGTLGTNGAPPVNLADAATLTGLSPNGNNDPPSGTVTFRLFAPSDPTCAGTPFGTQVVNLSSCTINPTSFLTNCATSSTFSANAAGVWHWTAVYSGNAENQSLTSGCAAEPVTVGPASPTLQTNPNPTTGTVLATPLSDVADLEGGYFPTGSITFTLFPPSDPSCVGAPLATRVSTVAGNGLYTTTPAVEKRLITEVGTYHWKAVYSGDGNNVGKTSPCADEPVVVTKPVLQIVKSPDNGSILAGQTATFTMVVTNLGPGVAKNGTLNDPLPAGGGVTWATSSPGCTVTGAVGSQVLQCFLGVDLAQNATFTAVATAATSPAACTVMNNTATAVATNADQVSDTGMITCTIPPCEITLDKTCSVTPAVAFSCNGFLPIQCLSMTWNGSGTVRIKGTAGVTPFDIPGVVPTETVQVCGYNGSQPDAFWNIYDDATNTSIGQSSFRMTCSDTGMNGPDDCFLPQGDNNGSVTCHLADNTTVVPCNNNWTYEGMSGNNKTLSCNSLADTSGVVEQNCEVPIDGGQVSYQYTVHNNTAIPVTVNVTDDKLGTIVTGATISGNNSKVFTGGPITTNVAVVNTATATGNPGPNQCQAIDKVIVQAQCFLGDPTPPTPRLYPYGTLPNKTATVFNESEVLRHFDPKFATAGDKIKMFYNDEHAMLIGIRKITGGPDAGDYPTSPFVATWPLVGTKVAATQRNPQFGAINKVGSTDPAGRPIPPALFCTDITNDPYDTSGDWQKGGSPTFPLFISGTWKTATSSVSATGVVTISTDADPAKNHWVLGPAADTPVGGFAALTDQGYGTEVRWDVNSRICNGQFLQPGHVYRMQIMVHDGDQNKTGGDVGQACVTVSIPAQ